MHRNGYPDLPSELTSLGRTLYLPLPFPDCLMVSRSIKDIEGGKGQRAAWLEKRVAVLIFERSLLLTSRCSYCALSEFTGLLVAVFME